MSSARCLLLVAALVAGGCASTRSRFDHHLDAQRWTDAARAFADDSTLHNNQDALYRAAMLHSSPDRATYDPALARTLLDRLLEVPPRDNLREPALRVRALLDELQRAEVESAGRERQQQEALARATAEIERLKAQLDSLSTRLRDQEQITDLLRRIASRLELDLRDREEQLRGLRDELNRLKEIDLKSTPRASSDTSRISRK